MKWLFGRNKKKTIARQTSAPQTPSTSSASRPLSHQESTQSLHLSTSRYDDCERDVQKWCADHQKPPPVIRLLFANQDLLIPFLCDLIRQEISTCDTPQTLFRGDNLASRIRTHIFKLHGTDYLKSILAPHINPLLESPVIVKPVSRGLFRYKRANVSTSTSLGSSDNLSSADSETTKSVTGSTTTTTSFEIDPNELQEGQDLEANRQNVIRLTKKILEGLLASKDDVPMQLNALCFCLKEVLNEKFTPEQNDNVKSVCSVIFLRFINPAITSPVEYGIVDKQPSRRASRGLKFVTKILQNVGNQIVFSKEEHMLPFNSFLHHYFVPVRQWVEKISKLREY